MPARKLVDDYAQFARTCQDSVSGIVDACGPKSPDSHRVVWGLTSRPPVSLCGLSSGFPFARRVPPLRPPSSGFPSSGVLRFVPFGRCPGSGSPSVSLRVPFPLSNLYVSAAAGRFRRRWSRAAGTKVTSPAATTSPGSRDPPALQMGSGWARWDLATESPVTSGRRLSGAVPVYAAPDQDVCGVDNVAEQCSRDSRLVLKAAATRGFCAGPAAETLSR